MTLVAAWFNREYGAYPSVWAVADTRISDGSQAPLTNEGAKLLELFIVCKTLETPKNQKVYYRSSIGFSYSGSALISLNTYATLSTLLANLASSDNSLPDYLSILDKAKLLLTKYGQSIRSHANICIYGFCPKTKLPFIGTLRHELIAGVWEYLIDSKEGFKNDLDCSIIGDPEGINKLNELILQRTFLFPVSRPIQYWRAPVYALREIITNRDFSGIGGDLQLTISELGRFSHHWVLNKDAVITNSFSFRNLDLLTEIGLKIGGCMISMDGMHFD